MFKPEMSHWQGRDDTATEGPNALRWHQRILAWEEHVSPGIALLGFACDEGVKRNHGRIGAAAGPLVLRRTLANLAWHQHEPIYDCGDVVCQLGDLEGAQKSLGNRVAHLLQAQHKLIILGGGHETAWGTFRGVSHVVSTKQIGIINFDAHFDLRQSKQAHSGTPFAQMADWSIQNNRTFHYLCLGVAESTNTQTLFDRASEYNVQWLSDSELSPWYLDKALTKIRDFIQNVDVVYLSIDLDVLPMSVMGAVSAPAALGVSLEVLDRLMIEVALSKKLVTGEFVEFNPNFDNDGQSARVAARLIWQLTRYWSKTPLGKRPA